MCKKIDELMEENAELKAHQAAAVGLLDRVVTQVGRTITSDLREEIDALLDSQRRARHAQAEQRDEWHAKSISEGMVEAVAGAVTPVSELRGEWAQRARDAQVEQQEATPRGKPAWGAHSYDQIFQTSNGNWFGARAGWDFKGHISDEWKGREVSLLRDDGAFLAYGEPNPDWENSLEQRPAKEAQGAQASEFQREDRYIVIKRKDLEAIENSGGSSDLETHEAVRFLAEALNTLQPLLPQRQCLVVESDWPEYEPTWAAIQARVTGKCGDERSHFETWFFETNSVSLDEYPHWNARDELGEYRSGVVDVAWGVWQARAALATQPAAGEPVAWMYDTPSNGRQYHGKRMDHYWWDEYKDSYVKGVPLYTAPPSAAHGE